MAVLNDAQPVAEIHFEGNSLEMPSRFPAEVKQTLGFSLRPMKSAAATKPTHIVKGNIFDTLGFSASEASALKVKAEILSAILERIRTEGYTQAQLADILDEHQPSVSNLLRGRIAQVSIEKLLRYADRLHLETSIAVRPLTGRKRRTKLRARPMLTAAPSARGTAKTA